MIDKCEFIDIKGFEGLYSINRKGEVLSVRRNKLLKHNLQKGRYRYYRVGLFKNRKQKTKRIHALLAETFIPNPNNFPEVNHINGIKTDNELENLEWVTHDGNMKHANQTGLFNKHTQKSNARIMGLQNRKISYYEATKMRELYESKKYNQRQLARMYGICFQNVSLIVNYKTQLLEDII